MAPPCYPPGGVFVQSRNCRHIHTEVFSIGLSQERLISSFNFSPTLFSIRRHKVTRTTPRSINNTLKSACYSSQKCSQAIRIQNTTPQSTIQISHQNCYMIHTLKWQIQWSQFFCHLWSKMGFLQGEIEYFKSVAIMLRFCLQQNIMQTFRKRYYKNFNVNL